MRSRLQLLALAFCLSIPSLAASFRSPNFVVSAPTPQLAQQAAQYAEHYRREKAIQWLGREMPPWPEPCPIEIKLTGGGSGGATSFAFDQGNILAQEMEVEGRPDRILASVLPHEITHTVLAHYFRTPVPRWADEGASVMSEDEPEKRMHDQMARDILMNPYRRIPLRRLFSMTKYPSDVMVLYALGYSVTDFLVARGGRPNFLAFLALGMRGDWDAAVRVHYGFDRVETLEAAWIQSLNLNAQPNPNLVMGQGAPGNQPASLTSLPQGGPVTVDSRGMAVPNWNREAPPPIYLSSQQGQNGVPPPIYAQQNPYPGQGQPNPGYGQNGASWGYPQPRGGQMVSLGQPAPAPATPSFDYPHPPVRMVAHPPHPALFQNQDWVGAPIPPPPVTGSGPIGPVAQPATVPTTAAPATLGIPVSADGTAAATRPAAPPPVVASGNPLVMPAHPAPQPAATPVTTQPAGPVRLGLPTPAP